MTAGYHRCQIVANGKLDASVLPDPSASHNQYTSHNRHSGPQFAHLKPRLGEVQVDAAGNMG